MNQSSATVGRQGFLAYWGCAGGGGGGSAVTGRAGGGGGVRSLGRDRGY